MTLQNLVNTGRFTIVIAEFVLHYLDKCKRESAKARESIRWLQNSIVNGQNSVVLMPTGVCQKLLTVEEAAVKYLQEKNLLERKSLFATILTTDQTANNKLEGCDSENRSFNNALKTKYKCKYIFYFLYFLFI